ncbi:cbb3-type cytochrome c oxidase subunit I [Rhodanobacter lindaniclasticus]
MRGRYRDMIHSYPLMFIFVAVIGYLIGSTQCTVEAFRSMQAIWHFTNFTVGHSHLTMYGFVTFALWGALYALLPLATGKSAGRSWPGGPFLAGAGGQFHLRDRAVHRRHRAGAGLGAWPPVHPVGGGHAAVLRWRGVGGMLMFLSHLVFGWNMWRMTSGQPGDAASPVLGPSAAGEVTA